MPFMLSDITFPDCLFRIYVKGIVVFASVVDIEEIRLDKSFLSSVIEDVQNILGGNYNT